MFGWNKATQVYAPIEGRLLTLAEVPDPVFSSGILGEGFAVDPDGDTFCAPVAGEVVLVAETLHAFAVRTRDGAEVLVHIGVDTVKLGGAGFTALRALGDSVEVGDPVIRIAVDEVAQGAASLVSPVVITNSGDFGAVTLDLSAAPGRPVLTQRLRT